MLDLSRDPSAAGVLDAGRDGEAPFLSEEDLAELATSSLRNCSLFMVATAGARDELSLGSGILAP